MRPWGGGRPCWGLWLGQQQVAPQRPLLLPAQRPLPLLLSAQRLRLLPPQLLLLLALCVWWWRQVQVQGARRLAAARQGAPWGRTHDWLTTQLPGGQGAPQRPRQLLPGPGLPWQQGRGGVGPLAQRRQELLLLRELDALKGPLGGWLWREE